MTDTIDKAQHGGRVSADQPVGAGRNRLEYRLHVRRRAGDHLQDVGGGGLPLQRLPGLVEQPGVLDGDYSLIGEAFQQRKLLVSERLRPVSMDDLSADRLALA